MAQMYAFQAFCDALTACTFNSCINNFSTYSEFGNLQVDYHSHPSWSSHQLTSLLELIYVSTHICNTFQVMVLWVVMPCCLHLLTWPWRWRQHGPLKHRYPKHITVHHHDPEGHDLNLHHSDNHKPLIPCFTVYFKLINLVFQFLLSFLNSFPKCEVHIYYAKFHQ